MSDVATAERLDDAPPPNTPTGAVNNRSTASRRPRFKLDPKPFLKLPEGRTTGSIMALDVGPDGHVWVVHSHRLSFELTEADRKALLPEVIEFDAEGNYIQSWGGPDHLPRDEGAVQWPGIPETITVDAENGVWVFGSGKVLDHAALRFSRAGELLLKVGRYGEGRTAGDDSRELLGTPTDVYVDVKTREAFICDGYVNNRMVVVNIDTGAFIRAFGAYGKTPPLQPGKDQSFTTPHNVDRGPDGLLYVCDRVNNRVQVFDALGGNKEPVFVRELEIAPGTALYGSAAEVIFPKDNDEFMYVADNSNCCIWIVNLKAWQVVGWFGARPEEGSGNQPDAIACPHRGALDKDGNMLMARVAGGFERYLYQGIS